jgi:hypothetical protein
MSLTSTLSQSALPLALSSEIPLLMSAPWCCSQCCCTHAEVMGEKGIIYAATNKDAPTSAKIDRNVV